MKRLQKILALVLALVLAAGSSCLSVSALETEPVIAPMTEEAAAEAAEETFAALENTQDGETEPIVTAGEPETQPEEVPEEVPEETEEEPEPLPEEEQEAPETARRVSMEAFDQEDYADVPFGDGTVADCGSGVTALAMTASYLTGYYYTPDVLARYFGNMDDPDWIGTAAELLGLGGRKTTDFQEVIDALEDGCLAICTMNDQSVFTGGTHCIVLTEITEEDRIWVMDPSRANREKAMLSDGFARGFPKGWISTGWVEAWTFDPADSAEAEYYPGEDAQAREMPLYNQFDYPNVMYGEGTIATNGCGITALAMVATYMTGHTYYPDELANYFGGYNGNNVERLLNASDELQLPWHKVSNWHQALAELKEGKIAILLMNSRSLFADTQHFIVAAGVTTEGKVVIYDPNGKNYSHYLLKEGFENGFTSEQIATGYSGAWVYDVDEMPEEPFIYEEEEVTVEPRYTQLNLSRSDLELLARLVWVEARGEPDEGQQAVAEVILNRLASGQFQDTMRGVIYADNQFAGSAYIDEAEPYQTQYEAVERALNGPYILPMEVTHFATYAVNKDVWGTIGRHTFCYQWSAEDEE